MDTKQKSLLVLTVAALGFLGYQVFQLVDRDITETPVIAEQQHNAAVAKNAPPTPATPAAPMQVAVAPQIAPVSALQMTTTNNNLTPAQHAYIETLNSFEVARMHHQLLDEEAAIAQAQQKIAVMHDKTAKIVSADGLSQDTSFLNGSESTFKLSYIDKQDGQWSATLHKGSDYESVNIGSQLPDGYNVIGIDHQGVTLQKGGMRELVSFNGTIKLPPLATSTQPQSAVAQHASLIEHQLIQNTAQAVKVSHGVLGQQANLMAMQLVHHGDEVQTVARSGLDTTPAQPALKQGQPIMPTIHKREADGLPYQISIHDANANEGADDLDNTQLSEDLHLRSVEIMPVMNQPYNTTAYLPQDDVVPQAYHLDEDASADDEKQYSAESSDGQAAAIQKVSTVENKILNMPGQYYTIQLMGSPKEDMVDKFVAQNHLKNIALTLSVGNDAHPWVIALYGAYHSFDEAEEKLVQLPANMRMGGAWIRRIGDVQKVVRGHA